MPSNRPIPHDNGSNFEQLYPYDEDRTDDYSFKGERLLRGRHVIHPYPAMLHPLLVNKLLEKYATPESSLLDPFCGTGVSLLQAALRGVNAYGTDINPLALLIAHAKSRVYDFMRLRKEIQAVCSVITKSAKLDIPNIHNVDYWFTNEAQEALGRIRYVLKNEEFHYHTFLLSNFALFARLQSNTKTSEFKRVKAKGTQTPKSVAELIDSFHKRLQQMGKVFEQTSNPTSPVFLRQHNAEEISTSRKKFDLVISSPPYGDSGTTVAYGQYSSFGSAWSDDLNPLYRKEFRVDSQGLGRKGDRISGDGDIPLYETLIDTLSSLNPKRALQVRRFFEGYFKSINRFVKKLLSGATICLVVGNRTVLNTVVPMDQITAAYLDLLGLKFIGIKSRTISNKVMPRKNSPSNLRGQTQTTMMQEFVVVFQKTA